MSYILDTNILLHGTKDFDLENSKLYIPITVLEELDRHNHSDNKHLSHKSRKAIRFLTEKSYNGDITYVVNEKDKGRVAKSIDMSVPDNVILSTAEQIQKKDSQAILITMDKNMHEKAKCFDINVLFARDFEKKIYKGYIEVKGDTEHINSFFENIEKQELYINEYIIVKDDSTGEEYEYRWDGKELKSLILPEQKYIKAMNQLQRCAIDLLLNKNITTVAVLGGYGSGKSYLCTQMATYFVMEKKKQKKILGIREPMGEGKDIGYLKGTFEDKTSRFFRPIEQQLKNPEEYDYLVSSKVIECEIPFYMKGTTYDDTIFLVDEAEDLTESQIRLIGTRIGKNSRAFFSGDFAQSIKNRTTDNALVKMCDELKGNPLFGCIYLDEDVRSETSKMFANLFK